jgi:hypothetical protein
MLYAIAGPQGHAMHLSILIIGSPNARLTVDGND